MAVVKSCPSRRRARHPHRCSAVRPDSATHATLRQRGPPRTGLRPDPTRWSTFRPATHAARSPTGPAPPGLAARLGSAALQPARGFSLSPRLSVGVRAGCVAFSLYPLQRDHHQIRLPHLLLPPLPSSFPFLLPRAAATTTPRFPPPSPPPSARVSAPPPPTTLPQRCLPPPWRRRRRPPQVRKPPDLVNTGLLPYSLLF
jgi:hypothetical protein